MLYGSFLNAHSKIKLMNAYCRSWGLKRKNCGQYWPALYSHSAISKKKVSNIMHWNQQPSSSLPTASSNYTTPSPSAPPQTTKSYSPIAPALISISPRNKHNAYSSRRAVHHVIPIRQIYGRWGWYSCRLDCYRIRMGAIVTNFRRLGGIFCKLIRVDFSRPIPSNCLTYSNSCWLKMRGVDLIGPSFNNM